VLVHFWHIIRGTKFTIVNTIHDSIITLFPKSETEFYEQASKFCFTDAIFPYLRDVYGFEFTAPLGAGIKFSRNWGQSDTEIIYNVRPDGTFTRKEK
jgi:hypothetical protein